MQRQIQLVLPIEVLAPPERSETSHGCRKAADEVVRFLKADLEGFSILETGSGESAVRGYWRKTIACPRFEDRGFLVLADIPDSWSEEELTRRINIIIGVARTWYSEFGATQDEFYVRVQRARECRP